MRSSNNVILYNIASLYVELLRGIPLLVVLLYVVFVITPAAASGLQSLLQLVFPEVEITTRSIPLVVRAMLGIGILYGAFMAEIFRSGIQSIDKGQLEAGAWFGTQLSIDDDVYHYSAGGTADKPHHWGTSL